MAKVTVRKITSKAKNGNAAPKHVEMDKQEFISLYRAADDAARYALKRAIAHFETTKQEFDKAAFNAYVYERLGEYRAYEKATDVMQDEVLLSQWHLEQIEAITEVASEYGTINGSHNTFQALFATIKMLAKTAGDTLMNGEQRIMSIISREDTAYTTE